jgi:NAD(P)-dependent dehydrogenase (short-subunit alcohol dehydrogenase family)
LKIVIIGATGTIGKKVAERLAEKHEITAVGRNSGELRVDIADYDSLLNLFRKVNKCDAVISIAGEAKWAPFDDLTEADYFYGLRHKLMGQVNLVRIARDYLTPGGSITLTTGLLADHPVPMTSSAAMVNGAIHSFVKAAALEISDGIRLNVVSPGLVEDSAVRYADFFPGIEPVAMDDVIAAYEKCLYEPLHGQIIRIYETS